ncbi:FRG domain-containing protein [[Haemophilus] felis]|uniref:FRG domain-containing protein n=1 Tax=[Haemophilus] felis TaxID=123822 RepID=A0A1T0B087_9PAST|nr:FRG domain-containing protein [[Haemophilus] felis]NBI40134.1 FRG domain-containing protein [[Haemophilus] felis]NBI42677.1 FRG domain-containing protein [[Haemophilus] felis]OOS03507.1 hypothetical protein B0188_06595 [[Haemophilus] felis]
MNNIFSRAIISNGVLDLTVNNYFEFLEFSSFFSDGMSKIYFRGQRDSSWKLTTTLDRFIPRLDPRVALNSTYDTLLNNFKMAIRGRVAIPNNDDEIWALGQHYGLATPFLDWTSALFIALFFAFEDKKPPSTDFRSIWGITRFISERMEKYNQGKDFHDEFRLIELSKSSDNRLLSQSGVFTKQPINFDMREWVEREFEGETKRPIMFKINIPNTEREKILKHLFMMDIHHATIYPDLTGAAKLCLLELEMLSHSTSQKNDIELIRHVSYT